MFTSYENAIIVPYLFAPLQRTTLTTCPESAVKRRNEYQLTSRTVRFPAENLTVRGVTIEMMIP